MNSDEGKRRPVNHFFCSGESQTICACLERQIWIAFVSNRKLMKATNSLKWLLRGAQWLIKCVTGLKSQLMLTLMALNLEGSLLANCLRTCLPAKPNEHKPCRMGDLKPEQRAFLSTSCSSIHEINTQKLPKKPWATNYLTTSMPQYMFSFSPPIAAKLGSIWRGFQSPLRRYKAACNKRGTKHCLDLYLIHKALHLSNTNVHWN